MRRDPRHFAGGAADDRIPRLGGAPGFGLDLPGKIFGLYQFLYLFAPGWRLFRGQERVIAWAALALALLAGYGAAWLCQRWAASRAGRPAGGEDATDGAGCTRVPPKGGWRGDTAWAAVIALVFAGAFFVQLQSGRDAAWGFTSASVFLALFLALAALAVRSRRPALLVAVLFLDLLTYNPSHHAVPLSSCGSDAVSRSAGGASG